MIYKMLYLRKAHKTVTDSDAPSYVPVSDSHREYWNNLEEALAELGATGWEIVTPIYNLGGSGKSIRQETDCFILVNKSEDLKKEKERLIKKLQDEITEAQYHIKHNICDDRTKIGIGTWQNRLISLEHHLNIVQQSEDNHAL